MVEKHAKPRGIWHKSGEYWFCDCPGAGNMPLLRIGFGQGGRLTNKSNPLSKHYCDRCQIFKPLKRDRSDT